MLEQSSYIHNGILLGISEDQLTDIQTFLAICNQHDGVNFPIHIAELSKDTGQGLLYYLSGHIVGLAYMLGETEIDVLGVVHPAYRRQGIGQQMLEAVKARCRETHATKLQLYVYGALATGEAFVHAMGAQHKVSEYHMRFNSTKVQPLATKNPDPVMRQALQAEATTVVDLIVKVFAEPYDEIHAWIQKAIQRSERRFFLIELAGEIIGTIGVVDVGQGQVDITTFGILAEHRGHGYGRQILLQTVHMLQAELCEKICLDVETANSNALSLYQACGFEQERVDKSYLLSF